MTRWTSAEIRPFVVEAVASHEAIIAEGRCTAWIPANFWTFANNPAYLVNNPAYIVVTKSRLLWRHLGASGDPAAFPLMELARADIESAQESHNKARAVFQIRARDGKELSFDFSRPQTKAAIALREWLSPL